MSAFPLFIRGESLYYFKKTRHPLLFIVTSQLNASLW